MADVDEASFLGDFFTLFLVCLGDCDFASLQSKMLVFGGRKLFEKKYLNFFL